MIAQGIPGLECSGTGATLGGMLIEVGNNNLG